MPKLITFILLSLSFHPTLFSQYSVEWMKSFGGTDWDEGKDLIITEDKGYAIAGFTKSTFTLFKLVKLDYDGNLLWERILEDTCSSEAFALSETEDKSIVLAGIFYPFKKRTTDSKIVKLDQTGNVLWQKNFGGKYDDGAKGIVKTPDGGCVVAGYTTLDIESGTDWWVIKLDAEGNQVWEYTDGGSQPDQAQTVVATSDGGFAIAGYTMSRGQALRAIQVVKLDAQGAVVWEETYRKAEWNNASSIATTSDNGFLIGGFIKNEGEVNFDIWIIRLDANGNIVWDKTLGTPDWDETTSIIETSDKGVVVAAFTYKKVQDDADFWILKLDPDGVLLWSNVIQQPSLDYTSDICETFDQGLIVLGSTYSESPYNWQFALIKMRNDNPALIDLPKIEIKEPKEGAIVEKDEYRIKSCISSPTPLTNIKIYVNDILRYSNLLDSIKTNFKVENQTKIEPKIQTDSLSTDTVLVIEDFEEVKTIQEKPCEILFEKSIKLESGRNRFIIEAFNSSGSVRSEERSIYYIYPEQKKKNKRR